MFIYKINQQTFLNSLKMIKFILNTHQISNPNNHPNGLFQLIANFFNECKFKFNSKKNKQKL